MRWIRLVWLMVPLGLLACGDAGDLGIGPPPSGGSLGRTSVTPECGALNQACLVGGLDAPLARGASLGLGVDYRLAGNSGPPTTLEGVNPAVIDVTDAVVTGRAQGMSGILILDPNRQVVDFIHLWVADATELRVIRHNDDGLPVGAVRSSGTVLAGDEIILSLEAFNGTQGLLGLFETVWQIEVLEGEEPIAIVEDIVFGWFRLIARGPGKVRLTADALGQQKTIELEVLP